MKYTFETKFNIGDEVYCIDCDLFNFSIEKGKVMQIQYCPTKKERKIIYGIEIEKNSYFGLEEKEISYKRSDLLHEYKKRLIHELEHKKQSMKVDIKELAKLEKRLEKIK